MPCILNESLKGLSLKLWFSRKNNNRYHCAERSEVRKIIRNNTRDCSKRGKGNKAWKRVEENEKAFRKSGGFYVSDFI